MLKEAFSYVFDTLKAAAKTEFEHQRAKKTDLPNDGRFITIEQGAELYDIPVPPPIRSHEVDSVEDIIAAAKKWAPDSQGSIWIGEDSLILVIDDQDRRERVTCELEASTVFSTVQGLKDSGGRLEQQQLVRLLRREFREAAGASEILAAVRKINFKRHVEGHATVGAGNESLGQTIENEVTGAGEISEVSLIVETNVFSNHGERDQAFKIELDLEVEPANRVFLLRPMPDEVENAVYKALCDIEKRISDELPGFPVFFGRP